jgi:ferredoxin
VLLLSHDPIALDSIACKIIDLNPALVPTSEPGEKSGLGTYRYENIEIVGDDVEQFIDKEFDVIRKPPIPYKGNRTRTFIKNRILPRPIIDIALCNNCGVCVTLCPVNPKAVDWHTGNRSRPPQHNYNNCIRCFCCQELCPEGAISIHETLLGKVFFH